MLQYSSLDDVWNLNSIKNSKNTPSTNTRFKVPTNTIVVPNTVVAKPENIEDPSKEIIKELIKDIIKELDNEKKNDIIKKQIIEPTTEVLSNQSIKEIIKELLLEFKNQPTNQPIKEIIKELLLEFKNQPINQPMNQREDFTHIESPRAKKHKHKYNYSICKKCNNTTSMECEEGNNSSPDFARDKTDLYYRKKKDDIIVNIIGITFKININILKIIFVLLILLIFIIMFFDSSKKNPIYMLPNNSIRMLD
jgi:hypothetical protein